jgi:integrase/recombinase XerD
VALHPRRRTQWQHRPGPCLVNGRDEYHPEGRYYLEWYEAGKRRRHPVPIFEVLIPAARAKSIELQARKAGMLIELPKPETRLTNHATTSGEQSSAPDPNRLTMAAAIDQ